jgi:hypothetical protein
MGNSMVAEIIAEPVPAGNSGTAASGIGFYRTGDVEALPGPDYHAGPDKHLSHPY